MEQAAGTHFPPATTITAMHILRMSHFDPQLVSLLPQCLPHMLEVRERWPDQ
ncbi:MAG: hypothetical protein GX665_04505 [Gammaproteobacteria bacterium]|nr:hypothetical protein [Gammaproteobacteria bacterium]